MDRYSSSQKDAAMVSEKDILAAYELLRPLIPQTPLLHSLYLSEIHSSPVYLKLENLNISGSFKIRGATHSLLRMNSHALKEHGVVTTSAGNHGQGVAYMARKLGIQATVFMPKRAPLIKVSAAKSYGAKVICVGENFHEAQIQATQWLKEHNGAYIHAFDHPHVVAGQGGVGLEILQKLPDVAAIIVPVGGGGLIGGISCAVKSQQPHVKVAGVQSHLCCAAVQHFMGGSGGRVCNLGSSCKDLPASVPQTLADGIAVKHPSPLTLSLMERYVDEMYCVTEEAIAGAMIELLERDRLLVEGAGAVSTAALSTLFKHNPELVGKPVVCVLSGGNVDASVLSRMIQRGLRYAHRLTRFSLILQDSPGALAKCLKAVAETGANLYGIDHNRLFSHHGVQEVEVIMELEVVDQEHVDRVFVTLKEHGYKLKAI